jgi:hypothetical protein
MKKKARQEGRVSLELCAMAKSVDFVGRKTKNFLSKAKASATARRGLLPREPVRSTGKVKDCEQSELGH